MCVVCRPPGPGPPLTLTGGCAAFAALLNHTVSDGATHASINFFWITGDSWADGPQSPCVRRRKQHRSFQPDRTVLTAPPRSHAPIYVCVHRDKSGQACGVDYAIWRFYLDGETTASVELQMSQAAFVGNADPSAPWDNEWFGKNSKFGGWHVNVPIPFTHSVRVTLQLPEWWNGTERIFAMVRGVEDLPVRVNSFELPVDARLVASVKNSSALAPLDFHDMINLPAGTNGLMLGTMIDIRMYGPGASSLNTLEGCWHAYSPPDTRTCAHARTQLQL